MSESEEESRPPQGDAKEETPAGAAPDAAAAADGEAKGGTTKPSNTVILKNLPADVDMDELQPRLTRHGELVSCDKQEDGSVVAKFQNTSSAYEAKEKLDGVEIGGNKIQTEFGAQEADHYMRGKKSRAVPKGKMDLDGDGEKPGGMRAWDGDEDDQPEPKRRKKGAEPAGKPEVYGSMVKPAKPVSKWAETMAFEEQLEDFMKMPRRGMYNRYLVIGKLPPELRTGSAIWQMVAPVQRDIMHIEMLTCFGKPVAHVALRSATAAAAMHRLAEQMHPNLTVAFAPARRASKALWLGNVDDFVNRKDLEAVLSDFGKLQSGLRYLPARTCCFAVFPEVETAVKARNMLYGMEVQKNQYLNVDFVDEWAAEAQEVPQMPFGMPGPWGMPPMPGAPWGMPPPFGMPGQMPPQARGAKGKRTNKEERDLQQPAPPHWGPWGMVPPGMPGMFPGMGGPMGADKDKRRTARDDSEEVAAPKKKKEGKAKKGREPAPASDSDEDAPPPKTKVKLYKMGEFCCNIVANFVKGKEDPELLAAKLHIDQRTKIDHCKSHMDRAGALATIWHFSAADRKDCAAYDALCDYFVEKERVGLVQTPTSYVYIIPPTDKYLKSLKLPSSNFVVGLQIPIKK
eukprot:TRINITY_DN121387_c0_g1_i1.p1 TRINITY_DN121387_c0_g1~~TRINITY_DN121387_c0_g1_i1.p1  ORF type:complete len:643 (+),score=198.64 TRINITY_DN121387_c0_g1_i1:54-1931(+)